MAKFSVKNSPIYILTATYECHIHFIFDNSVSSSFYVQLLIW